MFRPYRPFLFTLLLVALAFSACTEKPVLPPHTTPPDSLGLTDPHFHWADSVINTLTTEEKIGQLIMLPMEENTPSHAKDITEGKSAEGPVSAPGDIHVGWQMVHLQDAKTINDARWALNAKNKVPVMTALQMDSAWLAFNGYPAVQALGSMAADSGWVQLGRHISYDCNLTGVQVVFTSLGAVPGTCKDKAFFQGSDSIRVSSQLDQLLSGLQGGRVAAALQPFPSSETLDADLNQLAVHHLRPFRDMMGKHPFALVAPDVNLTRVDAYKSITFSRAALSVALRQGLDFDGLVFSADLKKTLAPGTVLKQEPETNPAVIALLAGCDVVVNPPDAARTVKDLAYLVNSGMVPQGVLDQKVRRVLWQKSWTRLPQGAALHPDSLRAEEDPGFHEARIRRLAEHTFVLCANSNQMLPLRHAETRKVYTLTLGTSKVTPFQAAFDPHIKADHFYLSASADSAAFAAKLHTLVKASDDLVVGLFPSLFDTTGALPRWMQKVLRRESKGERLAIVSFGGLGSLTGIDSLPCLLLAHSDAPRVQNLAGQVVMGGIPVNGQLPFSSGRFSRGNGVEIKNPIRFKYALPEDAGFTSAQLLRLDSIIYEALRMEAFPGCQVFVAKDNKVVYQRAFGFHSYDRLQRTTLDDLYDVASVTKVASTTLMVMKAADRDTHLLNGTLSDYIVNLDTAPSRLSDIRIEDLLIHQSGLAPAPPIYPLMKIIDSVGLRDVVYSRHQDSTHQVQISGNLWLNEVWLDSLWLWCRNRSVPGPRGSYLYSDYNFFMLMKVLEEKYGHRLDTLVTDSIYAPLGLHHTTYLPLHRFTPEQVAPTELDRWWRRELVHGFVHDQTAAVTAGVGGNAGLFSNAHDLGVIMQMLLNHGSYGGTQILSPATVTRFTSRSPYCYRGLGWDMQTGSATYTMVCQSASPACFGHIGFTGTCIWADPTHDIVFVFLSNRVHPNAKNYKINEHRIRQSLQQVVYESLGLYPPDPDCEHASFMESNVESDTIK